MDRSTFSIILSLATILVVSIALQSYFFLRNDTGWLMYVGERLLAGGTYTNDYIEINPPMSIYLYLPAVLFSHLTHLSFAISARIYTYSIALLSFITCSSLLKRIVRHNSPLYIALTIALLVIYMLFPGYDFSEREHIATMLLMPYFLLAVLRDKKIPVNFLTALTIGLTAGIGFAIKPHLLLAFVSVEMYLLFRLKKLSCLIRSENISIIAVILTYGIAAWHFNKEYLDILPYISDFFTIFFLQILDNPMPVILSMLAGLNILYILATISTCIIFNKYLTHRALANTLLAATIGLFAFAVSEPLFFDYHFIPPFSLSILLSLILLFDLFELEMTTVNSKYFFALAALTMLLVPTIYLVVVQYRGVELRNRESIADLSNFVKQHGGKGPLYFFTVNCNHAVYVPDTLNMKLTSSYECLWPAITLGYYSQFNTPAMKKKFTANMAFMTKTVTNDLKRFSPEFIFVDPVTTWDMKTIHEFDYIKYLSSSREFKKIWRHYKLKGKVSDTLIYMKS